MKRDFKKLQNDNFDLVVVGGGINGTGIARDAALRGLHVLLVEKEDFGYGTTSRSSRLIHGGLRYLRTMQFRLVRQDLREREILLKIAPHLVRRLRFLIPLRHSDTFYRWSLPLALLMYDVLTIGNEVPNRERLSRQRTLEVEPGLDVVQGLAVSYIYHDAQVEFVERLCMENALSAVEKGACIINHAEATSLLRDEKRVCGIQVQDKLTGERYTARGKVVVNAGGHWADQLWDKLNIRSVDRLRRTKGIHLVTKKLSENALVLFAQSDGRLFFVIPWRDYSLVGTTDRDYNGDLDHIYASRSDAGYLVTGLQHYFPQFREDDVYYTMAGLRPLVMKKNSSASDTSRAHKLVDHERQNGIKGLITVLGGKITAYRGIAEETVDLACRKLGFRSPCVTAFTALPGAAAVRTAEMEKAAQDSGVPAETATYLAAQYGSRVYPILEYARKDKRPGQPVAAGSRDILALIKYAVDEEEACTLGDFLLRRTNIGLEADQGLNAVGTVAGEMGALLGWSESEQKRQVEDYRKLAAAGQQFRL